MPELNGYKTQLFLLPGCSTSDEPFCEENGGNRIGLWAKKHKNVGVSNWGNLNKIWFWQGNSEWGPNYTRLQKLRKNLSEREGGTVHCINSILTSEQNVSKRNIHAERESKPLHPGDWNLDSLPDRHLSSIPLQPLTCQAESPSYRRPSENTAFANLWPFFFSAEIPMLSHFIFQSSEGKV